MDTKPIWHLITRVVEQTYIIFNYGVPKTNCKPLVAAFKAAFNRLALLIN